MHKCMYLYPTSPSLTQVGLESPHIKDAVEMRVLRKWCQRIAHHRRKEEEEGAWLGAAIR